ncbi:MAG TPA: alpha/beta hydrolase [Erysipelotrichaceae bacterium]|nr:alpha/beta hydrolase [Erysipelotrichaceae bacterium]
MKIYECGEENKESIILVHPSMVTWDYFENVIPLLKNDYHLFIPVLPGYDLSNDSEFTSVEDIASKIAEGFLERGIDHVTAMYGCSMGGSIVLRMAQDQKLTADHYVLDGGITPYQLPYVLTRFIAVRDFLMLSLGKLGGEKMIMKAFSSTDYSQEDIQYIANIFRHCSYKTIWKTFDSCNNYEMPKHIMHFDGTIHYWYAEKERKARDWDIRYMRKYIPDTQFHMFTNMDHGDMAYYHPDIMNEELRKLK